MKAFSFDAHRAALSSREMFDDAYSKVGIRAAPDLAASDASR
jgi:hypothetical protein